MSTPDSNLQSFLASIVESSDDAIVSKTLDGIVTSWNRAAERIFGYTAAEMIGRPISVLAVPERYEDMRRILETIRRGERIDHYETVRRRKDGRIIHVSLSVSPVRDTQGTIVGASKIARDITDRKRVEQEKAALLEEVRKAVAQRDEFLAMLAHELRNPLAPLRNSIHLLRLKGDDPSVVARVNDMMDRQVTHLGRLVNDLLDVSRITQGMVSLNRQRADLARLVAQVTEDHRGVFEAAGVTLQVDLPETPVWVNVDHTRLVQVLENLFENAGKFTEEGGKIGVEVVADRRSHRALLTVRDTGIGVDPEMLPRIFDVFTQADRSLDRRRGGLGLGLALVKRLVQLHGGEVEARSPGLGQGTAFTVSLPLEEEPTALTDRSAREPGPRKQVKVLVVEDNRDSAESLRLLLASAGYDVTLAFSGTEGVELAHRARPDVVVCDIGLPGMDGYAVARALRNDPGTRRARLIAVTGYGQEGDRTRALESGFDKHLVKPADPETLLSLIC
jgi:PAS domain S-box-containing protein